MYKYELQSQDVSAVLDFKRFSLSGSTKLVCARLQEGDGADDANGNSQVLLPLSVPVVSSASYSSVKVNGSDAVFHVAKGLEAGVDTSIVNEYCPNVDLLTFDGMHVAAQHMCNSLLYVELKECSEDLTIEVHFEYLQLESISDSIFFEKHWILPRCSTSYREYITFASGSSSDQWFPTVIGSPGLTVSENCSYQIDVIVPEDYTAICGLPINEEVQIDDPTKQNEGTTRFSFKSDGSNTMGPLSQHSFGLFVGEFELWDDTAVSKKRKQQDESEENKFTEDEDVFESYSRSAKCKLNNKAHVTYVTLKSFGFLLEPTNIATSQCMETYRRTIDLEFPTNLFLLFLPLKSFPNPTNMASHIRTQNQIEIYRCTAFTGSESYLHSSFLQSLWTCYQGMYYQSGNNMIVYSMDALHSYSDIDHDPRSIDCRILIAHGLALPFMLKRWINPSRDMHLDLMTQACLVEQFIKRNMGVNEYKVRIWALREMFATLVEFTGDDYPLCQHKGTSVSTHILLDNKAFLMKCQLISSVVDSLFMASNFLSDNYFIQSIRRRIVAISKAKNFRYTMVSQCASKADSSNTFGIWSDGYCFWKMLSDDIVRRYINTWNTKPPNRLVLENQIDIGSKLEDILRRGVEHDHLGSIMKQFNSLVRSFIYGTGCPQLNMGFALQLQRKGTSMDHLNFRVDIKPLQPPLDVNKDGKSAYSLCYSAGKSVRNLLVTYRKLAKIMQYDEHSEENHAGTTDRVFKRVLELYGMYDTDRCTSNPHALDFADIANPIKISSSSEAGILRRNMGLLQIWHDSIDLVGRDGNFLLGFGYIGTFPYPFCLGNGPLSDCVDVLKQICDINSLIESYVDNGGTYCGSHAFNNGYEKLFGKGSLPVASNGGIPFWKLVHQQAVMMDIPNSSTPLSAGLSKQWVAPFKVDIVEDDGIRENVKVIGDLLPASYKVNPRAERGRKKVAIKGVPEKDLEDAVDDTNRKNTYVGSHSESDRMVIEWMKMLFIGIHPELAQLDNRSVVAKICSKIRLPLLWMRVDSSFRLVGRIRRCQSSSMWEQQLMSDNNICSQFEAASALGSFARSIHFTTTENPVVRIAIQKLEVMIRRHRIHPAIRARCLYSLVCLHNRDVREHELVQTVFSHYLASFSLNNTGANYWHPSESRFMLDFFKAIALLRNSYGFSPQSAVDMLAKVLEGMNGINYLVHATNIVECCSYLAIPPCSLRHSEEGGTNCLDIKRLWQLLWHLFRLDGIPGSGSCNRLLTAAFLRCLSRQPLLLELCFSNFLHEKDLGFGFDFIHFLPIKQNIIFLGQTAFELGQAYHSKHVHFAAIQALLRVLMTGAFVVNDTVEMVGGVETPRMVMVKLPVEEQAERIQNFRGIHHATTCCIKLCGRFKDWRLRVDAWDAFGLLVEELAHSHPVMFSKVDTPLLRETRDLLYNQLRPHAISHYTYHVQMYLKLRTVISLLFGPGYMWEGDPLPNEKLVLQRVERIYSGHSMPKIAAFRRVHGEAGSNAGNNWIEVAVEAVNALKELPQARWFLQDPENAVVGYRSMVRHPMWFMKIEQKALGGQYTIPMQFKADMALVFKNAKAVNKADSMPYADAVYLEEQFETLWPAIVRTFQKQAKAMAAS